jgi:ubiquitin carboxyl-terminal hydrolase 36/42
LLDSKCVQSDDSSRGASPVSVLENIDPNCSTSTGEGTTSSSDDNLMKNETRHGIELEKDETSQCRSLLLHGEPSKGSMPGVSKSNSVADGISPHRASLQDCTSTRYPCTMETTNLDRPSTPPCSKRLSPVNDFSVFDYEDLGKCAYISYFV